MAAARDLRVSFVLRLRDLASSGLATLQRRLSGLANMASRIGVLGGALAGLSLAGPIQQAAAFEDTLRQTAITAGRSGNAATAMVAEMTAAYERLALLTGQRSQAIAEAAATLTAANLSPELIQQFLPVLSRTATATGASLQDLSRLAIALGQNLRITSAEDLTRTLAGLTQAGKEGMFELRDMAREFPSLTAAAEALGLRGREGATALGAMLQVARSGASTGAEAANNLANFLQKITSPETVRNFREAGVNIEAVLADAARRGINPIEAVIQKVREISGGNMFRVGELFGDRQVLDFLRPMMANVPRYREVLGSARDATEQLLDTDFATRMDGPFQQLERTMETLTALTRRMGTAFATNMGLLNGALLQLQSGITWLDERFPGLVDTTLGWAGALIGLAGALGVLGVVLPVVTSGFRLLTGALTVLTGPVGLVIAALTAVGLAAYYVWKNWETIGPRLQGVWDQLKQVTENVAWFLGQVFDRAVAGIVALFTGLWQGVQDAFTGFTTWVDGWSGGAMTAAIGGIKAGWSTLTGWFSSLWEGIESRINAFAATARSILAPILAVVDRVQAALAPRAAAAGEPAAALGQGNARFAQRAQRIEGFNDPEPQQVQVTISAAPGTTVENVQSTPGVAVAAPARGASAGRY